MFEVWTANASSKEEGDNLCERTEVKSAVSCQDVDASQHECSIKLRDRNKAKFYNK